MRSLQWFYWDLLIDQLSYFLIILQEHFSAAVASGYQF